MNRRELLAALGWKLFGNSAQPQAEKRSLLVLIAEGWRGQALAAAGDVSIKTPVLERLIREGVYYRRAYTPNPACGPARAALLAGRYPHACGMARDGDRLATATPTLATYAARAGYATGFIGKWALDGADTPGWVPPERRHGFVEWFAYNWRAAGGEPVYWDRVGERVAIAGFEPEFQVKLAGSFLENCRGVPFLLVLSWAGPGELEQLPGQWEALYSGSRLVAAANVPDRLVPKARDALKRYYAFCSAVDHYTGKILTLLEELELARATLVVFTSDHGAALGAHGDEGSGCYWEECLRVPLILRCPGFLPEGRTVDLPVSLVDLAPALLSLVGIPGGDFQGQDFSGVLMGQRGDLPGVAYCQGELGTPREWRALIRGLDKIVVDREWNPTHLFNLGTDPHELENLVDEPRFRRTRDELLAILRVWARKLGDRILPSGLRLRE